MRVIFDKAGLTRGYSRAVATAAVAAAARGMEGFIRLACACGPITPPWNTAELPLSPHLARDADIVSTLFFLFSTAVTSLPSCAFSFQPCPLDSYTILPYPIVSRLSSCYRSLYLSLSSSSIMSLSNKLSITDVDLKGKRVLIRVSFLRNHTACWSSLCPSFHPIIPCLAH